MSKAGEHRPFRFFRCSGGAPTTGVSRGGLPLDRLVAMSNAEWRPPVP